MSSQLEQQLQAGIAIFETNCSQFRLTCTTGISPSAGGSVRFNLSKGSKELRLKVGFDFVTDLPGTKEYQSGLEFFLNALALRFGEQEYATLSGIPVRFLIEFPFRVGPGTYDYVHVFTETGTDPIVEANFSVHLTHTISMAIVSDEAVITEPIVINAVRKFIDAKKAVFYPKGQHPSDLQIVTIGSADYDYKEKRFVYHKATDEQIADFVKKKVYWLGFRRGNQTTSVCIADPYDAVYLGVPTQRLEQAAAILGADGLIQVSGLYAHAGNRLLQEARGLNRERAMFVHAETPTEVVQTPSETPATESSEDKYLYDVFVSHATEDKPYVEPLVQALEDAGIRVWFDKITMEWGDDLRPGIDRGLTNCRYGIVVFSRAFLRKKKWTEYELNSLFALEQPGRKIILPIWHGITRDDLLQYSAAFADRLAKMSSKDDYENIVESLLALLGRSKPQKSDAANTTVSVVTRPPRTKPNAIAFAWYETTGENVVKAKAFIRSSTEKDGYFTFDNSFGQEEHGTKAEIAMRFFTFDKGLRLQGYNRMQHTTSDPAFRL